MKNNDSKMIPMEIVSKIMMFSHPVMNENLKQQIKNFRFNKISFCNDCCKKHRFPRHFRCK